MLEYFSADYGNSRLRLGKDDISSSKFVQHAVVNATVRFTNYDCSQGRGHNRHLSPLSPKYKACFDLSTRQDIHVI
jgi:hypothetical protein